MIERRYRIFRIEFWALTLFVTGQAKTELPADVRLVSIDVTHMFEYADLLFWSSEWPELIEGQYPVEEAFRLTRAQTD